MKAGRDDRVDAFIANAADFAKPILTELRRRIHANVPGVEETIRWRMPYFRYKGQLLAGMAAFKSHCAFGFWHPLMRDGDTSLEGMGQFGKIRSLKDLPGEASFARLAKKAAKLIDDGVKAPPRPKRDANRRIAVPADLRAELAKNAKARANFEAFSASCRDEYVKWIVEAKREETRARRVATTVIQCAEGKKLDWRYDRA